MTDYDPAEGDRIAYCIECRWGYLLFTGEQQGNDCGGRCAACGAFRWVPAVLLLRLDA